MFFSIILNNNLHLGYFSLKIRFLEKVLPFTNAGMFDFPLNLIARNIIFKNWFEIKKIIFLLFKTDDVNEVFMYRFIKSEFFTFFPEHSKKSR